jgi:hypothetical protein
MKPDEATLERFKPIFEKNLDLVVKCFEEDTATFDKAFPQSIINIFFLSYVLGMMQPMTPGSTFNTAYKL